MIPRTISLPALPALVAGRALRDDATAAARRSLEEARRLLASYDVTMNMIEGLPDQAQGLVAQALQRRLTAANRLAQSCQHRLDDAALFCRSLDRVSSPVAMVEVSGAFFEMLSPYLDDAMEPVLRSISRRVGHGCSADQVETFFPRPKPSLAA